MSPARPSTPSAGADRPGSPAGPRGLAGRYHQLRAERLVGPGRQFGPHQLGQAAGVAPQPVRHHRFGEHGPRADPVDPQPGPAEQLAGLVRAEAPGDRAVRPRHEHHLGVRQVDQVGPVILVGEHGHAEHQGVDAGEHPSARPQHTGDLGDHRLGDQVHGQRPVVGDDAIRAAVAQEGQSR